LTCLPLNPTIHAKKVIVHEVISDKRKRSTLTADGRCAEERERLRKKRCGMIKTISVYFNGTEDSNKIPSTGPISLSALLHKLTIKDENNYSFCIDGCGLSSQDIRDLGIVFTYHLENQVKEITERVKKIITDHKKDQFEIFLYGFSRGGGSVYLFCQQLLKKLSNKNVNIHLCTFDTVPGNFINGVYVDIVLGTNTTFSANIVNLSQCTAIKNALVIFANRPRPTIACQAPLLPEFSETTHLEVDVTPGLHESAVNFHKDGNSIQAMNQESVILFQRVVQFMQQHGMQFNFKSLELSSDLICSKTLTQLEHKQLLGFYNDLAKNHHSIDKTIRPMHLGNTIFSAPNKTYLNNFHQKLAGRENIDSSKCILSIKNEKTQKINPKIRELILLFQLIFLVAMLHLMRTKFSLEENLDSTNRFRLG